MGLGLAGPRAWRHRAIMKCAVTVPPDLREAVTSAARLRQRIAVGEGQAADWQALAGSLAALGFHDRAARAEARVLGREPVAATPRPPAPSRRIDPAGVRIFLSGCQPPPDEADPDALATRIAKADYSYGFAMRGFRDALARIGVPHVLLPRPELIADIRDRSDAAINLHLAFYPPERLRLLKGAFNILCFAWEFDRLRLPAETTDPHAFADQATMLNRADMLWMPSAHGAAAVAGSVDVPVRTVPAPLPEQIDVAPRAHPPAPARLATLADGLARIAWQPLAVLPRLQVEMDHASALRRRPLGRVIEAVARDGPPVVFVTVLNLHDYRKQLRPMLEGFAAFAATRRNALLLVKASTPARGLRPINELLLAEQLSAPGERAPPLLSDRIWLTDDVLTREEMDLLHDVAAFAVCTAHAEGQNLPLLEAMGRGAVPVSVDHTAMADYVRQDNAVTVASTRRPFDLRLSRRYGMFGLETNFVSAADVHAALDAAMAMPAADYAARSAAALATVRDRYGAGRLLAAVRDATEAARAVPHG